MDNQDTKNNKFFVHESSYVDPGAHIGNNTRIWHFSHILKDAQIGENCRIGQNVMVGSKVVIGKGCKLQNNVSVYEGVTLEDDVFIGPSAVFTNVYNPRSFIERKNEFKATLVKTGATIGANATLVCGITVGEYAFIGAGAVVNKNVKAFALMVGVPARRVGWVCKCAVTLNFGQQDKARCESCGLELSKNCDDVSPI